MKKRVSTSNLARYLLAAGLWGFLVVVFSPNFSKLLELEKHLSRMKQKLFLEEKRNYFLKKEFNGLSNDPHYIERIAREKLGWCRPTETVYRFQTNPLKSGSSDSKKTK